jgi:hypothetical protein
MRDLFDSQMNVVCWIVAIAVGGVAWHVQPRVGLGVLGDDVVMLLSFLAAAAVFYALQALRLAVRYLRKRN